MSNAPDAERIRARARGLCVKADCLEEQARDLRTRARHLDAEADVYDVDPAQTARDVIRTFADSIRCIPGLEGAADDFERYHYPDECTRCGRPLGECMADAVCRPRDVAEETET